MPPTYKPLTTAGGLTGAPGIPAEVFAPPPNRSFDQVLAEQALLRAQAAQAAEQERKIADQDALRTTLQQKFGPQQDGTTPQFDPDSALQIAQTYAIQSGDLNTALAIEKTQRERKESSLPLTESQMQLFGPALPGPIPPGTTTKDLALLGALQRTKGYVDQVNDPKLARNRDLNAILMEQRATGTQVRAPTAAQVDEAGAANAFNRYMDNINQIYAPYLSENRAIRFLEAAANPNSAEARMFQELNLAAKQAALSLEARVTDRDFEVIQDIITPNKLDTNETILDRMYRLKQFVAIRREEKLNAMQAGGFNTRGLTDIVNTYKPTNPGSSALPRNPDGSALTREQFMQLRNGGGQ